MNKINDLACPYLSCCRFKKLNGKTIKVSGIVTIIKGLKNSPKEYDKEGHELIRQGRENDIRYIEYPAIEIIENRK